ncbi:MAG TPA: ABC transporter substrate-binding protein [Candidatus Paceibacterota bacterium]|nr:ABC transporter substrate-binding protein [Candidatus Paceibacterota bacterium]
MKNFFRFLRAWSFPSRKRLVQAFTATHGATRVFFSALLVCTVIIGAALILRINEYISIRVPVAGGSFTEGVVGAPRFINPILAVSDTDRDLTTLVYSGLMKRLPSGEIVPDSAEGYTVSSDGLTYTFTLKQNLTFHDKTPLTADDVVYTIAQVQNPAVGSPRRTSWAGITIQKIDDRTVAFTLPKPFGPFLEATTIGILPAYLWKETTPETFSFLALNTEPIGSGPYKFSSFEKKRNGIPTSYTFTRFNRYALGAPYIKKIFIQMYGNQDELVRAINNGDVVSAAALSPEAVAHITNKHIHIHTAVLPRVFGVFLNPNQKSLFKDTALVALIDEALDKEALVTGVFGTYARRIDGPVPFQPVIDRAVPPKRSHEEIQAAFEAKGWIKNSSGILEQKGSRTPLYFSLVTADTPELVKVAAAIRDTLSTYGIAVELKVYDLGALSQNAIQSRNFDALLFGHVIENEADLYSFWHSSQRSYPGLNITQYANSRVDDLLEALLKTTDQETVDKNLALLDATIRTDHPALFIYLPHFLYATTDAIGGISLDRISQPSDRFLGVQSWYRETEPVWKLFNKQ